MNPFSRILPAILISLAISQPAAAQLLPTPDFDLPDPPGLPNPDFGTDFSSGEHITVLAEVIPEAEQVALTTELFVIAEVSTPFGFTRWFHKTPSGFQPWNSDVAALQSFDSVILRDVERVEIFEGELQPGLYEVFVAFMQNDRLIHSSEPLTLLVQEGF